LKIKSTSWLKVDGKGRRQKNPKLNFVNLSNYPKV